MITQHCEYTKTTELSPPKKVSAKMDLNKYFSDENAETYQSMSLNVYTKVHPDN